MSTVDLVNFAPQYCINGQCAVQTVQQNGYQMIATGNWPQFFGTYGVSIIIALILGFAFSWMFRQWLARHRETATKDQMQVFISNKYLAGLFIFECAWLIGQGLGLPVWLTAAFFAFWLQMLGHEWAHVVVAVAQGIRVKRVVLEWRGDAYTVFNGDFKITDGSAKKTLLAGVVWDGFCFGVMVTVMLIYGIEGDIAALLSGIGMICVYWLALWMPGSDWKQYQSLSSGA